MLQLLFICSNLKCLHRCKDKGAFNRHLKYSKIQCTCSNFQLYKNYLAGLRKSSPLTPQTANHTFTTEEEQGSSVPKDTRGSKSISVPTINPTLHAPHTALFDATHDPSTTPMSNLKPVRDDESPINQFGASTNSPSDSVFIGTSNPASNTQDNTPLAQSLHSTAAPPSIPTFNPTPTYNQVQSESGFVYKHATAGQAFGGEK